MTLNLILILISTMIISAFIMIAFIVGLHYGSKVKKGEVIQITNPQKNIRSRKEQKSFEMKQQKESEYLDDILYNIDIYDGTGNGQKDIVKEV